ncbi:MAG: molybdopterin-guanine dinucleotide biosynthesis protein MobA [Pseudonocardia sp.]|nr:MAG: molybdopterin-guanine dinucleotide biosynthesis protein MobA [Pseudonocardia sp.]
MPKVLAKNGQWLEQSVHALFEGGCENVLVVLGAADADMPAGAKKVWASDWASGMGASLRAGLAAAENLPASRFALISVVDTPDVGVEVVLRVRDAGLVAVSGIARARFVGAPGHPVIIARRHWGSVAASAVGDSGARSFLRSRAQVVDVECGDLASGADQDYST